MSLRYSLPPVPRLALALLALTVACSSLSAQSYSLKYPYDVAVAAPLPGRVIVKLTSDAFARGVGARAFAADQPELGVYGSRPWITPELAAFAPERRVDGAIGARGAPTGIDRIMIVEYSALTSPAEAAAALTRSPLVEYAEPVYARHLHYATDDPGAAQQWYLDIIGARTAWDDVRADSSIVVAIVDAGIDARHEDLAAALWRNAGEMGPAPGGGDRQTNGIDDDGNGYIDDWQGYDFAGFDGRSPDNDPDPARESHGTEMAGIAAAIGDNQRGTVGVAFGARIMSLKITNEPQSSFIDPDLYNGHEAILYAAKMGADVINCSWGDLGHMRSEQEIITAATQQYGAVVVASAGNSSNDNLFYPAAYDGVLSVGAVESGDMKASFSNYNYRVDVSAPGAFIYAPILSNLYAYGSGTSHAAAVASGAAAIVRKHFPNFTPSQIVEVLRATTDDISGTLGQYSDRLGTGRINISTALSDGATVSSARLEDYVVLDATGDGILDPGETVHVVVDVRNHLAAAGSVIASLAAVSPTIPVAQDQVDLGAMEAGATATTPTTAFEFVVPPVAPNTVITLKFSARTPSRTNDSYIQLTVAPTYMTTDLNSISATFNSEGNIGYNGTNRRQGDGFRSNGGKDLIYHGGLMIGTDAARLSDAVRVGPMSAGTAGGLQMTSPYRLSTSDDGTVEIGRATFDDAHRDGGARVGVAVTMTTYEFIDPRDADYVLALYNVRNVSGTRLDNVHVGQYLDWDISLLGDGDIAALDESNRLGYVSNELHPGTVAGAAVLGDAGLSFNAVDNNELSINSAFPPELKWQLLASGVGARTTPATDAGIVIGTGPFSLEPGASRIIAFVFAASQSLEELRAAVARAAERYEIVSSSRDDDAAARVTTRVVPNPSFGRASIELDLPERSSVSVRLFDAAGTQVLRTSSAELPRGTHRLHVDLSSIPSGVYAYEVSTRRTSSRGTIVKLDR